MPGGEAPGAAVPPDISSLYPSVLHNQCVQADQASPNPEESVLLHWVNEMGNALKRDLSPLDYRALSETCAPFHLSLPPALFLSVLGDWQLPLTNVL